jgi:hypothetical protein
MKTILILIIGCILFSCESTPKKPFIIFYKCQGNTWSEYYYQYYDYNGKSFSFYDLKIYNIGDTIK